MSQRRKKSSIRMPNQIYPLESLSEKRAILKKRIGNIKELIRKHNVIDREITEYSWNALHSYMEMLKALRERVIELKPIIESEKL